MRRFTGDGLIQGPSPAPPILVPYGNENAAEAVQVQIDAQGFAGKMVVRTEIPMTAMGRVPKNTEPHPFPAFPLDIETSSTIYS